MDVMEVCIADVVFRDDLYPRIDTSTTKVQEYAETIDVLPPIEINQNNELIDGWHRWTAHKKVERETISATVTETESDGHVLELAIVRNAKFGLQMSIGDKKSMARRIYHDTKQEDRGTKKDRLAEVLAVTRRTVDNWLSRIDKDEKEERDAAIVRMWLACFTQDEIAAAVGITHQAVSKVLQQIETFRFVAKPGISDEIEDEEKRWDAIEKANRDNASHAEDFEVPIYNVWKQQTKSVGSSHFGNSESTWVDNLLYLYTDPFDVVVDPFAGGGSTIDVAVKRLRRHLVSDRKPIVEREREIRQHDLADGLLKAPWKDVKLVYLDPPYWKQAEGMYSDDPTDLANMSYGDFTKSLARVIKDYLAKLSAGACVALNIQPTQWKSDDRQFTDHVGDMLKAIKSPVDMRFSVPYESQQCNAQMVTWAKDNRKCLVLSREIVVWRKD
tara:strand:- start:482 stop:1810 length:1329 start_codon:yes stop_codon:yes gene_type:complete